MDRLSAHHGPHALRLRLLGDLQGLLEALAEGPLHKDVLARLDGRQDGRLVVRHLHGHDDEVDVGVLREVARARRAVVRPDGVPELRGVLLGGRAGGLGGARGERDELVLLEDGGRGVEERGEERRGPAAVGREADDADANGEAGSGHCCGAGAC